MSATMEGKVLRYLVLVVSGKPGLIDLSDRVADAVANINPGAMFIFDDPGFNYWRYLLPALSRRSGRVDHQFASFDGQTQEDWLLSAVDTFVQVNLREESSIVILASRQILASFLSLFSEESEEEALAEELRGKEVVVITIGSGE